MTVVVMSVPETREIEMRERFEAFIERSEYPCVGAKSTLARGTLKTLFAKDMRSGWDDLRIHDALLAGGGIGAPAVRHDPPQAARMKGARVDDRRRRQGARRVHQRR